MLLKGGGIRQKQLRSHLTVGLVGVALLMVGLTSILWLRSDVLRLATLRSPTVHNSTLALSGLQRSLAALRGWVALGDPRFKEDRRAAWREEIRPAVGRLQTLSSRWSDPKNNERLAGLLVVLEELYESQWWVEEVAQTPGNEPAQVTLLQNARPIADLVISGITAMIELDKDSPARAGRRSLTDALHEFRFALVACQADLVDFVDNGDVMYERRSQHMLGVAGEKLEEIEARRSWLTPGQRELLAWTKLEFAAYRPHAERVIAIRKSARWNLAQSWLSGEAEPRARKATELLSAMSAAQSEQMQADVARVILVSSVTVLVSLGLIASMALIAYLLSKRAAARLTQPIEALSLASENLAAGRLNQNVPVTTNDELGRLTQAFNAMRASLAERTAELEAFSYSVSHDLRAPLRAIDGFSRILLEDYADKLDPECNRLLNVICRNTLNMGQLIDDLLAFSRLGRQEMRLGEVDMAELAKLVFEELKTMVSDRAISLNVRDLPPSHADRNLIHQVFTNLLSNAVKFTKTKETPIIEVGYETEDSENIYYVKDNGVGFDMRYVDKLFGVFQRLHTSEEFEGTGVGLAIVHSIIRRHGGRIWAEGAVGEGATIYFTLSAREESAW